MHTLGKVKISLRAVKDFIRFESVGGFILLLVAALAIFWANSKWSNSYHLIFESPVKLSFLSYQAHITFLAFINDGLMTVFFFLVGLEIKREVLEGELSTRKRVMLPGIAALGGMVAPAVVYILFNLEHADFLRGWAIPAATDIAFALAIMTLVRSRVPLSLKVFVTALAIFDDIGAIIIIAVFYTAQISGIAFGFVLLNGLLLYMCNKLAFKSSLPYLLVGALIWLSMLASGLHPTLAGILTALAIPLSHKNSSYSPLRRMEHRLHPWVSFLILPLFGLANAGVTLSATNTGSLITHPLVLGVALGLLIGKQIGIFLASWLAVHFKWAELPQHVDWPMLYGSSVICGIGFTMSLFIGNLAFAKQQELLSLVKIGVLMGSLISALLGYAFLRFYRPKQTLQF